MAYTLLKNGDYVVNRATYEYMCDSMEDLKKIPGNRITTGSTAIVIVDGGLKLFLADSKDNWVEVCSSDEGGSSTGGSGAEYVLTKAKIISALGYTPADAAKLEEGCKCEEITKEKIIELLGFEPGEGATEELTKEKIIEVLGYTPIESVDLSSIEERLDSIENNGSTGGSESGHKAFKLLNEISIDESVSTIVINQDDEGFEYNLDSIYVEFEMAKSSRTSSIKIFVNELVAGYISNGITSNASKSSFKADVEGGFLFSMNSSYNTNSTPVNLSLSTYGNMLKGGAESIRELSITSSNGYAFPTGSIIRVYGR